MKIVLVTLTAVVVCATADYSENVSGKLNESNEALRSWNIEKIASSKEPAIPVKQESDDVLCLGKKWPGNLALKRPGDKNCVAIVRWTPGSHIILNPPGFNYGPIPQLDQITSAQADSLWATNEPTKDKNERTYKLSYGEDCFLDVLFSNGKINKYRLRAPAFDRYDKLADAGRPKLSDWQEVSEGIR